MSLSDNVFMDKDAYIKQLEQENMELKKRIEELERRWGINSKNSSKPPVLGYAQRLCSVVKASM